MMHLQLHSSHVTGAISLFTNFSSLAYALHFFYQIKRMPLQNNGRTWNNYHSLKTSVRSTRHSLSNAMLKTRNLQRMSGLINTFAPRN